LARTAEFNDFLQSGGNGMPLATQEILTSDRSLQVYLLGTLEFEAALKLQRRLHFDVTSNRDQAVLVLCEHEPTITIGRQGSRAHVQLEPEELFTRRWPVRWVNRGGGCLLHVPGQLALYSILPLDRVACTIPQYLTRLGESIHDLLTDFSIHAPISIDERGVWVADRLIAAVGVSVRDWVTTFGAYININPALDLFRPIIAVAACDRPMTSLERERRGPVRPSLVRERLIEHFRARFDFGRVTLFTEHPLLETTPVHSPRTRSVTC
jgi:lipoyl(octanoyl) transferase